MHTFGEAGAGVPAFLAKLWRLVEDRETNNLICWSKDGRSFIIQNQAQFARELLPLNYKHNNMASFIRQLNMYGFHKITSIDNGGLKFDRDEMEFSHPCFKRNCPYLLEHIKRKIANTKTIDEKATIKPEAVSKVLNDVKAMRGRQDSLDSRFSVMKQENEALWREIASLRQKHAKQQQIVNKLIQFLITIVQPSRNMTSVKRHMQLMINDTPEQAKLRKASESESECGPVIHELGEELFDEAADNDSDLDDPTSPYTNLPSVGSSRPDNDSPTPRVERPKSNVSVSSHTFDYSNQSADDALNPRGNATPGSSSVINTITNINPDGSRIVYHVTELPDNAPETPETFNDENHLTTPMVKELKRNQLLKMKSMQNKRKSAPSTVTTSTESSSPPEKMLRTASEINQLRIKTEQNDFDQLMFLNANYPSPNASTLEAGAGPSNSGSSASISNSSGIDNSNIISAIDPRLISPQSDESQSAMPIDNNADMYNTGDFIGSDMPSELFEDSPIIGNTDMVSGNNYSKYDFRPRSSSSGQALLEKQPNFEDNESLSPSKNSNLQLAKVNNTKTNGPQDDLRLSSVDEVNLHLDGVQDDLDTLKDLLRSDTYSLDANTLLGNGSSGANRIYLPSQLEADLLNKLFNDSDILGPYGLSMPQDNNSQDKKSSQLMTYQPIYDLADIMDINAKNNDNNSSNDNNSKEPTPSNSVLNTPYHE